MFSHFEPLQLLSPVVLLLTGSGLLAGGARLKAHPELSQAGGGILAIGLGLMVQVTGWPGLLPAWVIGFSLCYLTAATLLAGALLRRFHAPPIGRLPGLIWAVVLSLQLVWSAFVPDVLMRVLVLNSGILALISLPLFRWRRLRARNAFDRALKGFYLFSLFCHLARMVFLLADVPPSGAGRDWVALSAVMSGTLYLTSIHFGTLITGPTVAVLISLAVLSDRLALLRQSLERDPLSGLLNRRGLESGLAERRRSGDPGPWAVLLCDLDHFKRVNDRWGHIAGDAVLREVAKLLSGLAPKPDLACRLGGEEFCLLLRGCDEDRARATAGAIRAAVEALQMPGLPGLRVTLSIGLAVPRSLGPADWAAAFDAADRDLYGAKRAGRNRVSAAPPLPAAAPGSQS